jgi:hypothetical protein
MPACFGDRRSPGTALLDCSTALWESIRLASMIRGPGPRLSPCFTRRYAVQARPNISSALKQRRREFENLDQVEHTAHRTIGFNSDFRRFSAVPDAVEPLHMSSAVKLQCRSRVRVPCMIEEAVFGDSITWLGFGRAVEL